MPYALDVAVVGFFLCPSLLGRFVFLRSFGVLRNCHRRFRLNMLTSGGGLEGTTSSAEGNRLAAILLNMLDERDHRWTNVVTVLKALE